MINCEGDKTDMFLPLMFEVRKKNQPTQNLFKKAFGDEVKINPLFIEDSKTNDLENAEFENKNKSVNDTKDPL